MIISINSIDFEVESMSPFAFAPNGKIVEASVAILMTNEYR